MKVKIILLLFIFSISILGTELNNSIRWSTIERIAAEKRSGLWGIAFPSKTEIPYSKLFFGYQSYSAQPLFLLGNFNKGIFEGYSTLYSQYEIISINQYKNGDLIHIQLFPNGILSISAEIKNQIPDGNCKMLFRPFLYAGNSDSKKGGTTSNLQELDGIPQKDWITNGLASFSIETEGFFEKGEKKYGSFLKVKPEGSLRKIEIINYKDGQIISKSSPVVFNLTPYTL